MTLSLSAAQPAIRTPQKPIIVSPARYAWIQAVRAKVAAGMSKVEAIQAVGREQPDLYAQQFEPRESYRPVL